MTELKRCVCGENFLFLDEAIVGDIKHRVTAPCYDIYMESRSAKLEKVAVLAERLASYVEECYPGLLVTQEIRAALEGLK